MITIDYLKTILTGFVAADGHTVNVEKEIIEAPDIMEGLIQLAQTKGRPFAILFEEAFHYDDDGHIDVPVTRFEQSIYVMRLVNRDKGSRQEELKEKTTRMGRAAIEAWQVFSALKNDFADMLKPNVKGGVQQ